MPHSEELLKTFFGRTLETLRDVEDTVRKFWQLKQMLVIEAQSTGMHVSNLWRLKPCKYPVLSIPAHTNR